MYSGTSCDIQSPSALFRQQCLMFPGILWPQCEELRSPPHPCTPGLVALSEEQQVAIEVQDVCPPGANSLMLILWIGKGPGPQTLECLLGLLCLRRFAAAIFSLVCGMVRMGVGRSPLPVVWCVYLMGTSRSTRQGYLWTIMKVIPS